MEVTAKLSDLRIAPRKVRIVADAIRNKKIEDARGILNFAVKKSSDPILKLLNSAVSNAVNNFQLDPSNLYISRITVDEGRKLKRWMPRSRGRAAEIQKKTSNINIVLGEIKPTKKKKGKKEKVEVVEGVEVKEEFKNFKEKKDFNAAKPKSAGVSGKIFRRKSV